MYALAHATFRINKIVLTNLSITVEQVQSIFYTKHSILILPVSGEGRVLLRLLLVLCHELKL